MCVSLKVQMCAGTPKKNTGCEGGDWTLVVLSLGRLASARRRHTVLAMFVQATQPITEVILTCRVMRLRITQT